MMKRREFLKQAAIAGVTLGVGRKLFGAGSPAAPASGERVILLVNLYGGNDGINTVIPLDQYDRYRALRPVLAYKQEDVLALSGVSEVGLNPGLAAIRDLYDQGRVAIINGVGVPQEASGLFDHAAGQYEFQSCDIVRSLSSAPPSGWLGRYLDSAPAGLVSGGIDMGGGRLVVTGNTFTPVTITTIDQFQLNLGFDSDARMAAYRGIADIPSNASDAAERNRLLRQEALPQSDIIIERTANYQPLAQYPEDSWFGYQLQQCASLINADLGIRVLTVGSSGYDTHSGQDSAVDNGSLGYHDSLLQDVSDSIGAFHADLAAHGVANRVLILTISEFGRRAYENNDHGTDHGFSSVAFAIGDPVKGGVYGDYPSLSGDDLVLDGNTDVTTDFRSIYSTVAARYLDADPVPLVGGTFPLIGFL